MQYAGSKRRISRQLLNYILPLKGDRVWIEPFVGGCNLIDKVQGYRIGNDKNEYVIEMFKALQLGWDPPQSVTKEQYLHIKNNKELYSKSLVGFVGINCSFGAKWFGGFAYDNSGRNYASEGYRNVKKQIANLIGVDLRSGDYQDLVIPSNSLIYCDPPYFNKASYSHKIHQDVFWDWCRLQADKGHLVFVSECFAPDDFDCVLEIELRTKLDPAKISHRTEKLFIPRSQNAS
jgi:DNA adenine methylase